MGNVELLIGMLELILIIVNEKGSIKKKVNFIEIYV